MMQRTFVAMMALGLMAAQGSTVLAQGIPLVLDQPTPFPPRQAELAAEGAPTLAEPTLLVAFEADVSATLAAVTLAPLGLELVQPLRFTELNLWLVKAKPDRPDIHLTHFKASLQQLPGVLSVEFNPGQTSAATLDILPHAGVSGEIANPQAQAWHVDSRPYRGQRLPRVDVQAPEAWEIGQQGRQVTVAVIDSTIQWDHPDLVNQVMCLGEDDEPLLPDETCGYDFVEEDGDTRLSPTEIEALRPGFQDSFQLSDRELLRQYPHLAQRFGHLPHRQQVAEVRHRLRQRVESAFHGTWVAGVIAAQGEGGHGLMGVAPQAQILPVRVFDVYGGTTTARLIEATGYAAARGVDVINLSLGALIPHPTLTQHLFALQDAYPNLVIVASAGNENLDGAGFPAGVPGVLSVGATTLEGQRAPYSNYGAQVDLVAPGGDLSRGERGGILTTSGTWIPALWEGLAVPEQGDASTGYYAQVQGTSFAAPAVAGVVALMRSEDPHHRVSREALIARLKESATYEAISLTDADQAHYRLQRDLGFNTLLDLPFVRISGIYPPKTPVSAEQYYFGAGLVNALRAVQAMQR
ncbi:MAG: S8 family serine peptidase [Spirulina sp.]